MESNYIFSHKKRVILHSFIIFVAVFVTYFWVTSETLKDVSLQLTAILMLSLIFSRHLLKPSSFKLAESTISTMAVLLVTTATGGITSPLYFLNYFLLFELSLLLEPQIPLLLSGVLICYYSLTTGSVHSPFIYAGFLAFPFMTPLAYMFGKLYQKEENQKKEIKNLSKKVEALEEEIVEKEIAHKI